MSLSNYAEEGLLKHFFGKATFTSPTQLWLGLSAADPTDTAVGTAEPSGNGYARINITSLLTWNSTSKRIETNGPATFAAATGSWGTITHHGIWDASTGGNLLISGAVTTAKSYGNTDVASFAAAELYWAVTGHMTEYTREKLLKLLLLNTAWASPATYAYLSTADPGATGAGIAEPASAYARQLVSAAGWTWNAGLERIQNVSAITFPTPTGNWGTIGYGGIADAATAGNVLLAIPATAAKAYNTADVAEIPAGEFSQTLD